MKRKKKQKSDYIPDEDFQRMMKLQMAETRKEAIEILRTDPNLTEEQIQRMIELWPEEPEIISGGMTVEELNEAQLKMVGLLPATDEERRQLMMKIMELTEEEATALLNKMQERRRGGD